MNWLNSEAFTLLGQHIKWSDMIGNIIGLIGLALGWRRSIWSWPVQLLSGVVLFAAFASGHLSGSSRQAGRGHRRRRVGLVAVEPRQG